MTTDQEQPAGEFRLTYRFRLKDKHAATLAKQARAVNFVWNFCNHVYGATASDARDALLWSMENE